VYVNGPVVDGEGWPVFMVSYPNDRPEFHVPQGTDLRQWMSDNNLLVDEPQPDTVIAGTTAIHTRFAGSPQSYAADRYFFVHQEQMYAIVILHTARHEDWAIYNQFLGSFQFIDTGVDPSVPTPIPTALPVDPTLYQDWMTYTHAAYGFTLRLPDTWIIDEPTGTTLDGHLLTIHPVDAPESIRLTFREIGGEVLLWPTGVGEGEFIPQGTLDIAGQPAVRLLLVCPSGEVTSIWYHQAEDQANIARGNLEFGIIFSAGPSHCAAGYSLSGETQRTGEMIIASLRVP
jgi:hypothetical protein